MSGRDQSPRAGVAQVRPAGRVPEGCLPWQAPAHGLQGGAFRSVLVDPLLVGYRRLYGAGC